VNFWPTCDDDSKC